MNSIHVFRDTDDVSVGNSYWRLMAKGTSGGQTGWEGRLLYSDYIRDGRAVAQIVYLTLKNGCSEYAGGVQSLRPCSIRGRKT